MILIKSTLVPAQTFKLETPANFNKTEFFKKLAANSPKVVKNEIRENSLTQYGIFEGEKYINKYIYF